MNEARETASWRIVGGYTHPVRRRLEGSGRGPRRTRVSAASPSSRFTRHYTMSQGWQLVSLDSRLRLQLAREELALSLPPNPEDAPLLLTPQPPPPDRLLLFFSFFFFPRPIEFLPNFLHFTILPSIDDVLAFLSNDSNRNYWIHKLLLEFRPD